MKSFDKDCQPNRDYQEHTDEELIELLRAGDSAIMDYLMEKYKPLVRKKTNAMYLMGGETEDLIQEGMIGLFKAVRDYEPDYGVSFFAFAELCITRQLYTAIANSNRKKHQPLNSYVSFNSQTKEEGIRLEDLLAMNAELSPEQMVIQRESQETFFESLSAELSQLEQQVLDMYLDGKNYLLIAEELNKSPKSIDNALQRIRKKTKNLGQKQFI